MNRRPRLLDLFCCAGGSSVGYNRAGFDVVGVDIDPMPNFPYPFRWENALTVMEKLLSGHSVAFEKDGGLAGGLTEFHPLSHFDAIHASPPCQSFSAMSDCRPGLSSSYPDLIDATRQLLIKTDLPYVIENVPRAPLIDPIWLCGRMFDLKLYRHRGFETNWSVDAPAHPAHNIPASKAGHWKPGTIMSVAGHVSPIAVAREAMGIDWMTRDEMSEALPPAYTQYIGEQLIREIA